MAKAQVSPAGDVAELVISAPPLNLFDGQESLLEQGRTRPSSRIASPGSGW